MKAFTLISYSSSVRVPLLILDTLLLEEKVDEREEVPPSIWEIASFFSFSFFSLRTLAARLALQSPEQA